MIRPARRGFTLVELMVALVIGVLVLASARGLLDGLGAQAHATLRAAGAADARENARDELRRLTMDLIVRRDTIPSLTGDDTTATFRSSCESARGWMEPCDVTLRVVPVAGGFRVHWTALGDTAVLGEGMRTARLRYLLTADAGGEWTAQWSRTAMIPAAIGIVMDDDTLLATIGEQR